ncbi:hypothetical protein AKJ09_07357 [Labilithrix luteola]|uniref:Type IV fimbrial biogenesis protein PilY1 n=1 Tax=Labilithrix luteola TaxID=1391654 RepID=A0A0K1Q4M7_9BACT|nr:hypothetical protein [Labilithrix luteola]AKV00694.1 hypothetical protein AKJ09_07357 [Labilithrix luteola]
MSTRLLLVSTLSGCAIATVLLLACASDAPVLPETPPGPTSLPEAGSDAVAEDADAAPCADCEYFPETCSGDVLCANGLFTPNGDNGLDMRAQINVVRGRAPNDVWAVGALGAAAHFDGTSWAPSDLGRRETLRALWLQPSAEVTFGTLDSIYTRGLPIADADAASPSPGGWTAHGPAEVSSDSDPSGVKVTSAWSASGSHWLWCGTMTWNAGTTSGLWRLRISAEGKPQVADGIPAAFCVDLPCSQVTSIHGSSANDLWAVGYRGAAVRVTGADGDAPTMKASDTQTWDALYGVWMASESEAWAVGANGTVRHHSGNDLAWEIVSGVPTTEDLRAVWGSSPSDIWAVGNTGVALHYDGTSWSRVKIAGLGSRRPDLTTVWMPEPGHVWIGGHGVILSLGGKP